MRRCQIVEASQHLAPRAVGTAVAGDTSEDRRQITVPLAAAPPHLSVASPVGGFRSLAVFVSVPLPGYGRIGRHQIIKARQNLFSRAVGTAVAANPCVHRRLIAVTFRAFPPGLDGGPGADAGCVSGVFLIVPFKRKCRLGCQQIRPARNGPSAVTVGTAAAGADGVNFLLPGVPFRTSPPDKLVRGRTDRFRTRSVFLSVPESGRLRSQLQIARRYKLYRFVRVISRIEHPLHPFVQDRIRILSLL